MLYITDLHVIIPKEGLDERPYNKISSINARMHGHLNVFELDNVFGVL